MLPKFGVENLSILGGDADSLFYHVKATDFYKDSAPDVHTHFDTSDYPREHPSSIPTGVNKKVLGMFKDEMAGKPILGFRGTRPKQYCFSTENNVEKRVKGVKKSVVAKCLDFEHYDKSTSALTRGRFTTRGS